VDPVTHSLTGAALSRCGLHRVTPLATATLVVAANAPDIDIAAAALGSYASLALRRGITHGPLAVLLLPFAVTGAILLYDRLRRRRRPDAAPVRPLPTLGLAFLGVLSHPALDWLNTYGVRLLMPFSERWFYGDSLFIIDPWVWLALAAPLVGIYAGSRRGRLLWAVLAVAATAMVMLAPQVPLAARIVWIIGLGAVIATTVRYRRRLAAPPAGTGRDIDAGAAAAEPHPGERRLDSAPGSRSARVAVAAVGIYILLMIAGDAAARSRVATEAVAAGLTVDDLMVAPVPANPLAGEVVVASGTAYHLGSFGWLRRPHVQWSEPIPMGERDATVIATLQLRQVRDFLRWSRFPYVQVTETPDGHAVRFGDARYPGRMAGGLSGITVQVDRAAAAPDLSSPPDSVPAPLP
jgi:inner membrane protein